MLQVKPVITTGSQPGFDLGGKNFFRGERVSLYYVFKTRFSGHKKFWGDQKFWGALPPNARRGYGPGCNWLKQVIVFCKPHHTVFKIHVTLRRLQKAC